MASLKHLETCFGGALLHAGLCPQAAVAIVDQQHQMRSPRAICSADYLAVLKAVARMATNVANAVDYTSDSRYPNAHWLSQQPLEKQRIYAPELFDVKNGGTGKALPQVTVTEFPLPQDVALCLRRTEHMPTINRRWEGRLGRSLVLPEGCKRYGKPAFCESMSPTTAAKKPTKTWQQLLLAAVESWDSTILSGQSVCADCEDVAGVCVGCLQTATQRLEHAVKTKETLTPLMRALHMVLSTSTPLMVGAAVSSPYVDTSADAGANKKKVSPPHPELPLVGSVEDAKMNEGSANVPNLLSSLFSNQGGTPMCFCKVAPMWRIALSAAWSTSSVRARRIASASPPCCA